MVTHVDEISTPPTPADPPAVFEERAAQVWSDLSRAVRQMNEQALENSSFAQAADISQKKAAVDSDLALGHRNESRNARDASISSANSSAQAAVEAKSASTAAAESATQAKASAETVGDLPGRVSALEVRKPALGDGQTRKDVTRMPGVNYTNTTGRTIEVGAEGKTASTTGGYVLINVNGKMRDIGWAHGNAFDIRASCTILDGENYSFTFGPLAAPATPTGYWEIS